MLVARVEAGVAAGNRGVIEDEVVSLGAADGELPLEVGHPRNAEIDVVDLELFHREEVDYSVPCGSV